MNIDLLAPTVTSFMQSEYSAGILYPPIEPYAIHRLSVSQLHELYVEESGNKNGFPVIVLHGGPGGAPGPGIRRFFDPAFYRIIVFHQRGCGKSTYLPGAQLSENTTHDLVIDIERIRAFLNLKRWLVFGGSWGSFLALWYAIVYPEAVAGLVLRGIFLGRKSELEWFYGSSGACNHFPEMWDEFIGAKGLKPGKNANYYLSKYHQLLNHKDEAIRLDAARRWAMWEEYCYHFRIDLKTVRDAGEKKSALELARIENHYFFNNCFQLWSGWILDSLFCLKEQGIIAQAVSGRYDCDCPRVNAVDLKKRWPSLELIDVPGANHAAMDSGNVRALVNCTDWWAVKLGAGGLLATTPE